MKKYFLILFALALCLATVLSSATTCKASEMVTAKEGLVMSEFGDVLYQKNATEKRPIASMTKIMTLLCVYDAIENGKVSLDDNVVVSKRASDMGGSQVFLEANATYKLENLVKSVVICSANDSCVALAEHICGSVENFVDQMNQTASKLNLVATHFENCTGLPHISQFSCALDVATMFRQLIKYPHYFKCANIWMEDFQHPQGRVTGMTNTNKLVRFYDGCDGGKTGYTSEAMHCLCATAKRGDTRVIAVVVGAEDSKTRFAEVSALFNYAFANYHTKCYLKAGEVATNLQVSYGKQKEIPLAVDKDLCLFQSKQHSASANVQYVLQSGVVAPIKAGDVLGTANLVDDNGKVLESANLVATKGVERISYWENVKRIVANG